MQNKQKHTLGLSSSLWKVRGVLEHREILKTLAILRKGILFRVSDFSYIYNLVAKTYKFTQLPEAPITKGFSNRVINTRQTSILYPESFCPNTEHRHIQKTPEADARLAQRQLLPLGCWGKAGCGGKAAWAGKAGCWKLPLKLVGRL